MLIIYFIALLDELKFSWSKMSSVGFSIGNSSAAVAVAKVFNVNVHPTTEKLETLHSRYRRPPFSM